MAAVSRGVIVGQHDERPLPTSVELLLGRRALQAAHQHRVNLVLRARAPGGRAQVTVVEPRRSSSDGGRFTGSARAAEMSDLEPFAVEMQPRDHVTIVQPRGELDIATVETLRSTLDVAIAEILRAALDGFESAARLVLDLRGLSFIDSTGLHLLMALDQRAQRDGSAPDAACARGPIDRAIQLSGLDQVLPFVAPDDAVDTSHISERPPSRQLTGGESARSITRSRRRERRRLAHRCPDTKAPRETGAAGDRPPATVELLLAPPARA
jgi:anti-sigma B factor antagonist